MLPQLFSFVFSLPWAPYKEFWLASNILGISSTFRCLCSEGFVSACIARAMDALLNQDDACMQVAFVNNLRWNDLILFFCLKICSALHCQIHCLQIQYIIHSISHTLLKIDGNISVGLHYFPQNLGNNSSHFQRSAESTFRVVSVIFSVCWCKRVHFHIHWVVGPTYFC